MLIQAVGNIHIEKQQNACYATVNNRQGIVHVQECGRMLYDYSLERIKKICPANKKIQCNMTHDCLHNKSKLPTI